MPRATIHADYAAALDRRGQGARYGAPVEAEEDAPVTRRQPCRALAGFDPERVERMRAGWAGEGYAR